MNSNQKKYLLPQYLFSLGGLVTITFTNLYLWELTNSLTNNLQFNIAVFTGIIFGALFSGVINSHLGPRFSLLVGALIAALQLTAQATLGANLNQHLTEVGLLSGIAFGLIQVSSEVINQLIADLDSRAKLAAAKIIGATILAILTVPAIAWLIKNTGDYNVIFTTTIGMYLAAAIASYLPQVTPSQNSRFIFRQGILMALTTKDLRKLMAAQFISGISQGIYWVILGIVTLDLFGDILQWGIFAAVIYTVTIISAFLISRVTNPYTSKTIDVITTFMFASVTLILIQNWDLSWFILYQLSLAILTVVMASDFGSITTDIIAETEETKLLRDEINALSEVISSLGKLLPIYFLLLAHVTVFEDIIIKALFLVVAPIPFVVMTLLSKRYTLKFSHN